MRRTSVVNHPNRGARSAASHPAPEEVLAARESAGLTQSAAARLVYSTLTAWQKWEWGMRSMHPALYELFRLKTGQTSLDSLIAVSK